MIKLIKIWLLKERIKEQDSYQHWLWAKYWNNPDQIIQGAHKLNGHFK